MAVHTEEITELSGGFSKSIEESAMTMILDNLQVSQYQYPEKSTIRELVSNAVDSTKEKFQALSILNGEKQESDFYIRRDGAMFKDSNFNPAYFNQKWLGAETQVQIIYEEGSQLERDKVRIIDQGVGLGGKRLEGYFKLGWSSKRNSVSALGKFGIGAKSALSTGVDYYTVKTRYNGMEFIFNVYSHKVDSVIPPIDLSTGTKNESYLMYEGTKDEYKAYWRPTAQPNGTEVTIEVKKHKKQQYIDAVKSQLLYFDNVSLVIHQADGYTHPIPVKANILFENEYLIVSDNNQYSKPHLVINKVNYGYVDFQELELEQKMGNVGIKVAAEDVSVNPSRESVIWNEQTKKTIQTRFKQAAEAATTIVQEQLKTDDFVHWLRMWANLKRGRTGNDTLSKLSGIVDMATLAPTFPLDSTIKASNVRLLFPGMQVQRIQEVHMYKGGKNVRKLERTDLHFIGDFDSVAPIVLTNAKPKPTTLRYLATVYQQGYYLIRYPENLDKVAIADGEDAENWIAAFEFQEILNKQDEYNDTEFKDNTPRTATTMILANRRKRVVALLEKSNFSQRLDKVQVPDDFSWTADDEEEEVKADLQDR
jgi:hypothetical protein